jgi:Domain of unknown function (DUF3597)
MSVFGKILDKLGMRKKTQPMSTSAQQGEQQSQGAPQRTTATQGAPQQQSQGTTQQQRNTAPAGAPPAAMPMSDVDVAAKLDKLAAENPQKLNWRTSIVDLMKLLGMESSLQERKELAEELGYPREGMSDSAKMNIWLHKAVLWEISKNGGNVPKELLD